MEGVVQLVNQETAFFAVETENGFTVFEAADAFDVELGDEIAGDLESATCETVLNETKGEHMEVFVQDLVSTLNEAKGLVFGQ